MIALSYFSPPLGAMRYVIGDGISIAAYEWELPFLDRCRRAGASATEAVAILERVRAHPDSLDRYDFHKVARDELAAWRKAL